MKNLDNIIRKHLRVISEQPELEDRPENYMFFDNIKQMERQCNMLMKYNENTIDSIMKNHDWAQDHISEAKSLLDQVFDFLKNQIEPSSKVKADLSQFSMNEETSIDEGKNKPTNPKLWAAALSWARARYDVCPSAYCNGAAAKRYKQKGGKWRKVK
jgi:hypothetical protein